MAKINLRASGGLDSDVDLNNLQDGDYISASNIILESGKGGGLAAIKQIESIDRITAIPQISGTIKATFQNTDGKIYVLTRLDSIYSAIYVIPKALNAATIVVKYAHSGVSTSFVPDLKVIGDTVVWNYAENGTVMSFYLNRTFSDTPISLENLKLAKKTPNNAFTVRKVIDSANPNDLLESNDFQFAARYKYDSGELSVLSSHSQMFKGEKDTSKYEIVYNFTNKPTYASEIELYVKQGNAGTWRRADIASTASNSTLDWTGQTFESLDSLSSSKPFDAVPVSAKNIEVAKNRIFLANIQDDYSSVGADKLSFSFSSGYTLGGGGTAVSYLNGSYTNYASSSETTADGNSYAKPFANNSTYAFGIAYYDETMKTRGVEAFSKYTTGKFKYGILPDVTVSTASGYSAPSWAKYIQLVYTENLSKSYVYEGFASNVFFEVISRETDSVTKQVKEVVTLSQSLTKDQVKDVKSFVVDLMGMYSAGRYYTFNDGDRITIATESGAILDMEIIGQLNNFVYCRYVGGALTNAEIPTQKNLYFEIYTKRDVPEDEALVFYEYGNLIPFSGSSFPLTFTGSGTLGSNKLIGDMVFTTLEMAGYNEEPFIYSTIVDKNIPIEEDQTTVGYSTMSGQELQNYFNATSSYSPTFLATRVSSFTSLGTAQTEDSIVGGELKIGNFYFAGEQDAGVNKLSIDYKLGMTLNFSLPSMPMGTTYSYSYSVKAQVYKKSYDNIKKEYNKGVKFGQDFTVIDDTIYDFGTTMGSMTKDFANNPLHIIELSKQEDISANDRFFVEFSLNVYSMENVNTATITIGKSPSSAYAFEFRLVGDKNTVKVVTSYNTDAQLTTSKQKFIVRSMSNAVGVQSWNTSKGKPNVKYKKAVSDFRTNSIRYSGNFVAGTDINNINSFFGLDANDVPIENGQIISLQRASRLQGSGDMLLVLCERECSYIFLGEQELSQGNNLSIRALSQNMIGTIRNLGDGFGILDKPSVYNYKGTIFWWDDYNKKVLKFDDKGLEVISDYKMRSNFLNNSGIATICYDPYYDILFVSIGSQTTSKGYSKNNQRWRGDFSFVPDFAESYGDRMILFKGGYTYKSLGTGFSTFFGTTYDASIQFVANSRTPVLPLNVSISHNMNVVDWSQSNGVKSTLLNIGITNENGQSTQIVESNFLMEDNVLYAHVMRDTSSGATNAISEGNYIIGYLNKFVVTLRDRSQQMNIDSLSVEVEQVSGH